MRHRISFVLRGRENATAVLDYRAVRIALASLLTGLIIGAVGGAFRLLVSKANDLRHALVVWAHAWPYLGWLATNVMEKLYKTGTPLATADCATGC
jgi:hypothetical protein